MLLHAYGDHQVAASAATGAVFATALKAHLAAVNCTGRNGDGNGLGLPRRGNAIVNLLGHAAKRVVGRDLDIDRKVASARSPAPGLATKTAKAPKAVEALEVLRPVRTAHAFAAHNAAQDIVPRNILAAITTRTASTGNASEGEHLIVLFALLLIRKRVVRLRDLLELLLVAAGVGMVLLRKFSKCRLDLFIRSVFRNAQNIVERLIASHGLPSFRERKSSDQKGPRQMPEALRSYSSEPVASSAAGSSSGASSGAGRFSPP